MRKSHTFPCNLHLGIKYIFFLFAFLVLAPHLSGNIAVAATERYQVELLPLAVEPVLETSMTRISGTFKLFKGSSRANDLDASEFSIHEDSTVDRTVACTIRAPDDATVRMADFIFAIDVTGSMGGTIEGVKTNIKAFADSLASSSIDYRLAMVTFRDDVVIDNVAINPSRGVWTSDVATFKEWAGLLRANGGADGPEASFDAVGRASDFSTREGAQRIIVLFTDIQSHTKADSPSNWTDPAMVSFIYDQASLIAKLKASGFVVYVAGPNDTQFNGSGSITGATGGMWYPLGSSVSSILTYIREEIRNQYAFNCTPETPAGEHSLEVGITKLGYERYRSNRQKFIVKAAPIITLSEGTSALIRDGFHTEKENLSIEVVVSDVALPYTKEVTLYYRQTTKGSESGGYTSVVMKVIGDGSTYRATVPRDVVLRPGVDFYIMATDGERNGFSPKADAISKPWKISIVNHPPKIDACTPSSYDVEKIATVSTTIADDDGDAVSATLFYKVKDGLADYTPLPMTGSGTTYTVTIPATATTAYGIDAYIVATDTMDGESKQTCSFSPVVIPVIIKSMTRQEDTNSTSGPYPVRTIALSADTVTLHYMVNGGEEKTMEMPIAVSTTTERTDRSNIYYADIPGQAAASKVEYWATASNRTSLENDRFPKERNYAFVVRPVPEEMGISPESQVVAPGETASFVATGCYSKPYNWTTTAGTLSTTTDEKTTLTASEIPGMYTIRAEDLSGICAVTARVEIVESLAVRPSSVNLSSVGTGNKATFFPQGGEPPYTWNLSGGPATMVANSTGDSTEVTAASTGETGSVVLTVTDSKRRKAQAQIAINGPFKLTPAGTITAALSSKQAFTAEGGVPPYTWTTIGGNTDTATGETITYAVPSVSGAYTVMVTDSAGSTNSTLVIAGTPLLVTPSRATVALSKSATFDVSGGVSPYRWVATEGTVTPLEGNHVTFTPPEKLGSYQVTVADASGFMLNTTVEVINSVLTITPSTVVVKVNGTTSFKADGGLAPYTWTATGGTVSDGNYTAPNQKGEYTVTVTDKMGKTAAVKVTVILDEELVLTPETASVGFNGTVTFKVDGGVVPYSWSASEGSVTSDGVYTAPAKQGSYTVTVKDSMGKQDTATVTVIGEGLVLTPGKATVGLNKAVTFKVNGGVAPYSWSATEGSVTSDGVYTAPAKQGAYTVTVTDGMGKQNSATVTVINEELLALTPKKATLGFKETISFKIDGGVTPYTWSATEGSVTTEGVYTAPEKQGTYTITITDSTSKQDTATITVINEGLVLTPKTATVGLNGTVPFNVDGGIGPYTWAATEGSVTSSGSAASTSTYTAPAKQGTYVITVKDNMSRQNTATVTVSSEVMITPSTVKVGLNGKTSFTAIGGVPPYVWTADGGSVSDGNYTAPGELGTYTIAVTDSTGKRTTATITVDVCALSLNPSATAVTSGHQATFVANCGSGEYLWKTGKGTLSTDKGISVIYSAPTLTGEKTNTIEDSITVSDPVTGIEKTAKVTVIIDRGLRINPMNVSLDPGKSQTFRVDGAEGVSWTASSGEITDGGEYTAPTSSGTYTVIATDYITGQTAEAMVTVTRELTLTPTEKVLPVKESADFTVSGGEPPYTWRVIGNGSLDNDMGDTIRFTADKVIGKVTLVVTDNKTLSAQAAISVTGAMQITPEEVVLPRAGSQTFKVFGGYSGELFWKADQGNIDNTGKYTAPNTLGTYVITASDTAGNEATTTVTVSDIPVITPANAWLEKDGKTKLTVVGGIAPYRWEATAGNISGTDNEVTYQAPGLSSDVKVTVYDHLGNKSEASIYVDLPLLASRKEMFLRPGETAKVMVVGGIPSFDWQTDHGTMEKGRTDELGENLYTAPNVYGDDMITIRDRKNDTTAVKVRVVRPLLVTPHQRYMKRQQTKSFTVASGIPPYTAVVSKGEGNISPAQSKDGHFEFTSGDVADKDMVIEFRDNIADKGNERVVLTHVYVERQLRTSPAEILHVPFGATRPFSAIGGTGDFFVVADCGNANINPDTGIGSYTAPDLECDGNLTIIDSSDQETTIKIKVGYIEPQVSPSIATLIPDQTGIFMVSNGAPTFKWAFEGNTWQGKDSDNSVVEVTAPKVAGNYKLTVKDGKSNEASAMISVVQPLVLSPTFIPVYRGESAAVRISKVGGAGACDWSLIGLQELKDYKGPDYIVVRPRTDVKLGERYTVSCRDQAGDVAKSEILVTNLPIDLDANGIITEDEIAAAIERFFKDENIGKIKIDRSLLFLHLELFLSLEN